MKKQFCNYEISAAMEELGFKDECLGYYDRQSGELFFNDLDRGVIVPPEILLPAPLWQQVIDWFREKHQIYISPRPFSGSNDPKYQIHRLFGKEKLSEIYFACGQDYKEARAAAITKAIEIVKEKMKSDSRPETCERPPMDTIISTAKCPECGAPEIPIMSPRTVYACGSSDYDQRPGTFAQSEQCMKKTGGEK